MAAIGSGINPALGRIDYSPFLQGAQMAAQGRMQGSNALTEGISQGFQDYLKKREQNAILEGKNNALLRDIAQNPSLSSNPEIQKYTAKMAKGGGLTLNDNIKLNAELTTAVESARMRQEEQRQQAYLKLQQDSAAINAERAAREKAEYERRNTTNTTFMRGLVSGKAKTPEEIVMLGAASGMSPDEIRQATGMAIDLNNYQQANDRHKLNLKTAQMEYDNKVAAYQRAKDKGNPEFEVMTTPTGVSYAVFRDPLTNSIIKTDQIELAKPNVGEKTQRNALEYHVADIRGDEAGKAKAMINIRSDNPKATENLSNEEVRQSFIDPFVPKIGGETTPTEPLRVTGAPKPVSAPPAPSPEAARITQSPSATPPSLGRTFAPMAGAAPFEAPSPMAVAAPAPQPAAAPAPAIQYPPVQDIIIPQEPRLPVQDIVIPQELRPEDQGIILDESLLPKPATLGRTFAPAAADRNQPPVISETMLRKAAREAPIRPGQKYITASQLERLRQTEEEQAPAKLRQSAIKILEPKRGDSANTLAIKQIIPYLPNPALADSLLKELSEKKEPSLSSIKKDPVVRSMFEAAKEGRLPQLNMAAGRGF